MQTDDNPTVNEPRFWEGLYESGGDRWELRRAAPPLEAHLDRSPPPPGKVAVLGCGRGHDARLLARKGYQVWGFDFASQAVREARALARHDGAGIVFEQKDIFELTKDYRSFFDGVWEYTCYCAIAPARRPEYARLVRSILKPEGWLLACFFPLKDGSLGPPFPTNEAEIRKLFTPHFTFLETYAPAQSAAGRAGFEWMIVARARASAGHATMP